MDVSRCIELVLALRSTLVESDADAYYAYLQCCASFVGGSFSGASGQLVRLACESGNAGAGCSVDRGGRVVGDVAVGSFGKSGGGCGFSAVDGCYDACDGEVDVLDTGVGQAYVGVEVVDAAVGVSERNHEVTSKECCVDDVDVVVGRAVASGAVQGQDQRSGGDKVEEHVVGVVGRGKWYSRNRRKRDRARDAADWRRRDVGSAGLCQTAVSCESGVKDSVTLVDAEKTAKESFARRRAAENAVAEKLAKMKLASLEDEKKCQEYADLKSQRVVQWRNESVVKSQRSLEQLKSIDPSSSASQYEIRRQAKELADLKFEHGQLIENVRKECGEIDRFLPEKRISTESMDRYQLEGEFIGGIDEVVDIY